MTSRFRPHRIATASAEKAEQDILPGATRSDPAFAAHPAQPSMNPDRRTP